MGRGSFALVLEVTDSRTGERRRRAPVAARRSPALPRWPAAPAPTARPLPPCPSGERLAAKKLPKYKHNKLPCQQAAVVGDEVATLRALSAAAPASILRFRDVRQDDSFFYLITEVGAGLGLCGAQLGAMRRRRTWVLAAAALAAGCIPPCVPAHRPAPRTARPPQGSVRSCLPAPPPVPPPQLCLSDLGRWLSQRASPRLSEREAAHVLRQLLSGLATCHRHGLAYRDVKPANLVRRPWALQPPGNSCGPGPVRVHASALPCAPRLLRFSPCITHAALARPSPAAAGALHRRQRAARGGAGRLWMLPQHARDAAQQQAERRHAAVQVGGEGGAGLRQFRSWELMGLTAATQHRLPSRASRPIHPSPTPPHPSAFSRSAPECITGQGGCEADVWSAGILLFHLLSERFPFCDPRHHITQVRQRGPGTGWWGSVACAVRAPASS